VNQKTCWSINVSEILQFIDIKDLLIASGGCKSKPLFAKIAMAIWFQVSDFNVKNLDFF